MWVVLFILGVFGGVFAGLGMGGGTLTIPLFSMLGLAQNTIKCINLASFIPTGIVAVIIHGKNGLVRWKNLPLIIIPAVFSTLIFSVFSLYLPSKILKRIFGVFLLVLAILLLLERLKKQEK